MATWVQARTLENHFLKVDFDETTGAWSVLDKESKTLWKAPASSALIPKGRGQMRGEPALLYEVPGTKGPLALVISLDLGQPLLTFVLSGDPQVIMKEPLAWPSALSSRPGDFLLLPKAEGQVVAAEDLAGQRDGDYNGYKNSLGLALDTNGKSGYALMLKTPMDAGIAVKAQDGLLALQARWMGQKGKLQYSREWVYAFTSQGGHVALAKVYRELALSKGWLLPFSKKKLGNPNLDKLMGAVDLWALDQNLPKSFYDDLAAAGVKKALVSLGGDWQGPKDKGALIAKLGKMGYLPSRYDIYVDVWNKADKGPSWLRTAGYPDQVIQEEGGQLQKGWLAKEGSKSFQGFRICSRFQAETARKRIAEDLKENPYLARFIDVVCATGLTECYSPVHGTTRTMDHHLKNLLLSIPFKEFHLVTGSEEIREWAVRFSDFDEGNMTLEAAPGAGYDWSAPVKASPEYMKANFDGAGRVPLFELVYHEGHVSTWYTGDGYGKVPEAWEAKEALNVLYGTMPLWMPQAKTWAKDRDRYIRSYKLVNPVFEAVAGSEMLSHEFLSPDREVQRTVFSSGVTVTANLGPKPWPLDPSAGTALPQYGFLAEGTGLKSYRWTRKGTAETSVSP